LKAGVYVHVRDSQGELWSLCRIFGKHIHIPNLQTEIRACNGYPDGQSYYADCLKIEHHHKYDTSRDTSTWVGRKSVVYEMKWSPFATADGYAWRLQEQLQHLLPNMSPNRPLHFWPTSAILSVTYTQLCSSSSIWKHHNLSHWKSPKHLQHQLPWLRQHVTWPGTQTPMLHDLVSFT
jgi:hypothetical protein